MPLLLETLFIHLLTFGLGLVVGAAVWKRRGSK